MRTLLMVAAGGALGSVMRFLTDRGCIAVWGDRFGFGTLAVNVVGCFLLGLLAHGGFALGVRQPWLAHPGLTSGLLGGLTTFSTFGYQTVTHLERGERGLAALNILANVVVGCLAAAAGLWASKSMTPA